MPQNEIHLILLWPELFKKKNTAIPWNYSVFLVRQKGFEPPASPLGGARSIQLSY